MATIFRSIIMGAGGRDFHEFQVFFRRNQMFSVCAFTCSRYDDLPLKRYPKELAGADYANDIPIYPEGELAEVISRFKADFVFLAYGDLSHSEVMHRASIAQAHGASFALLSPRQTQLKSRKPVIAVTSVRTGAGKSPLAQSLAEQLGEVGASVGVLRHPLPTDDLRTPTRKFESQADLMRFQATMEEREEIQVYVDKNIPVYAGPDYGRALQAAERRSDIILWDGGNNEFGLIQPDLKIVVADALRPEHETEYYPGETNFREADVIVINKTGAAREIDIWTIRNSAQRVNPSAELIEGAMEIDVLEPKLIRGKRALVVEDGPTVTRGGMSYGAGMLAAKHYGAASMIDPRRFAVGSIRDVCLRYPHLYQVLPALGYSERQCAELAETINASGAEVVIDASPARLDRVIDLKIPTARVEYRFRQVDGPPLISIAQRLLGPTGTSKDK